MCKPALKLLHKKYTLYFLFVKIIFKYKKHPFISKVIKNHNLLLSIQRPRAQIWEDVPNIRFRPITELQFFPVGNWFWETELEDRSMYIHIYLIFHFPTKSLHRAVLVKSYKKYLFFYEINTKIKWDETRFYQIDCSKNMWAHVFHVSPCLVYVYCVYTVNRIIILY